MIGKETKYNVVQAAEKRIVTAFNRGQYIFLSLSGGKDSICMADLVFKTMQKYGIPFDRLCVVFFDEEAVFPDVERCAKYWRNKYISAGAKFLWFCLPIRHYNCCNKLADEENWYCWEEGKQDEWCRDMPKFAIREHSLFKLGMSYQEFCKKTLSKSMNMYGVRAAESIQRSMYIKKLKAQTEKVIYPIYDWTDNDVWLYIKNNRLDFPEAYIYMYQVGTPINKLRISQFFAMDTIKSLPRVLEFYPGLFERILKREPNAELVLLYADTEMFRSSKEGSKFKTDQGVIYRNKFFAEFAKAKKHPDEYLGFDVVRQLLPKFTDETADKIWKKLYMVLITGDAKKRTSRLIKHDLKVDRTRIYNEQNKK